MIFHIQSSHIVWGVICYCLIDWYLCDMHIIPSYWFSACMSKEHVINMLGFLDIFSKQDWQSCSLLFSDKALFLQLCYKQTAETKWIPDFSDCICFLPLNDDNTFLPLRSYSTLMVSSNKFPHTSRVVRKLFKRISMKHQTSWAVSKCSLVKEQQKTISLHYLLDNDAKQF